jgi:hypothetical protein
MYKLLQVDISFVHAIVLHGHNRMMWSFWMLAEVVLMLFHGQNGLNCLQNCLQDLSMGLWGRGSPVQTNPKDKNDFHQKLLKQADPVPKSQSVSR